MRIEAVKRHRPSHRLANRIYGGLSLFLVRVTDIQFLSSQSVDFVLWSQVASAISKSIHSRDIYLNFQKLFLCPARLLHKVLFQVVTARARSVWLPRRLHSKRRRPVRTPRLLRRSLRGRLPGIRRGRLAIAGTWVALSRFVRFRRGGRAVGIVSRLRGSIDKLQELLLAHSCASDGQSTPREKVPFLARGYRREGAVDIWNFFHGGCLCGSSSAHLSRIYTRWLLYLD
jgi:hypothetical protein